MMHVIRRDPRPDPPEWDYLWDLHQRYYAAYRRSPSLAYLRWNATVLAFRALALNPTLLGKR